MSPVKSSSVVGLTCIAFLAAVTLFAGAGIWFGYTPGVVAVVVTPRQYVPIRPSSTQVFSAVAHRSNGSLTNISATGATWQCDPLIGFVRTNQLYTTNVEPAFGWVQATYSGLTTRVYVKVTSSGAWNPDLDGDGDGFADKVEITSNTSPAAITLENVKCRLTGI